MNIRVNFLILFLIALSSNLHAQAPLQRYYVCKRPLGQACNSGVPPISCGTEYRTSDPCQSGKYYSVDGIGNLIELSCCSFKYGAPPADVPFVFDTHNFLPADTLLRLRIQCAGSGMYQDWYDFSSIANNFDRPGIEFRSSGDSLFVDIFDTDSIEPFIKAGTLTALSFHSDYFIPLCIGGTPFVAGLPESTIIRLPKLGFSQYTNPVENGTLKFAFVNYEIIPSITSIQLIDISGKLVKNFLLNQLNGQQEEQLLDIRDVRPGTYFLSISTALDQAAVQIVIKP